MARVYGFSERFLDGMDSKYSRVIQKALVHRPTVIGLGTAAVVAAVLILPTIGFELMPQADEGEVILYELGEATAVDVKADTATGRHPRVRLPGTGAAAG